MADQLTKYFVLGINNSIQINSYLNIVLRKNTGITFGLFGHFKSYVLIILAILICFWIFYIIRKSDSLLEKYALCAVMAGALGNIIDRISLGGVIDFLDFHFNEYHWFTFNLADVFICLGIAFYAYLSSCKNVCSK